MVYFLYVTHYYGILMIISKIYNILTYPWERGHRQWRKELIKDCFGTVCEIGVGTGLNIDFYPENIILYLIDQSKKYVKYLSKKLTTQL